ncbi:MAG: site-specific DNA-methyltransferase, partial [Pseudomonadota bacterium]|nr:site-specific DNA-methyltransferase [Pseudomonadota bacterium]
MTAAPGNIRDAIISYMEAVGSDASLKQISEAVTIKLGTVPQSSIRSYLNLNVDSVFERTRRGRYQLVSGQSVGNVHKVWLDPAVEHGKAKLFHADCFDWLAARDEASIHAVVTDPPYGLTEYSQKELEKLRSGQGGVWRVPPSFDGHQRAPLPRFTIMSDGDRKELHAFFKRFGALVARAIVPGGNVVIATNPLFHHVVASAMSEGGLELRGTIVRLTMTMR